jgi:predicted O-linked N-acetylglucosamine transferase (SPINDLY family)
VKKAYEFLLRGNYSQAEDLYNQAILQEPKQRSNYGYLGLALILQEKETEAQIVWSSAVSDLEDIENWVIELAELLNTEAERFNNKTDYLSAKLIRQHLNEISPLNIYNLSELARLSLEKDNQNASDIYLSQLVDLLKDGVEHLTHKQKLSTQRLVIKTILEAPKKKIENHFSQKDLQIFDNQQKTLSIIDLLADNLKLNLSLVKLYLENLDAEEREDAITKILEKTQSQNFPVHAAFLYSKICFEINPDSILVLRKIINQLQLLHLELESVEFAKIMAQKSQIALDKTSAYYSIIRGLMNSGTRWQEAHETYTQYKCLIEQVLQKAEDIDNANHILYLSSDGAYSFYLNDSPSSNHDFLGRLGRYYQSQVRRLIGSLSPEVNRFSRLTQKNRKLRIGYISECIRRHSVGWLSRWLLVHHDLSKFDVSIYSLVKTDDNIQNLVSESVTHFHYLPIDADSRVLGIKLVAEKIYNDNIDILIDLDMLTSINISAVMALKPAPIQVSWLGSDDSGIPSIDYFIADPYVLPNSAESYYNPKIWRLPQTYLAIDGFEIGVPTLRREDLNIPPDAVIYLCVQAPHKLQPDLIKSQMQIIKQVPESFFILKSIGMTDALEKYISEVALSEGVPSNRLRFLYATSTEEEHRANLAIADVILDTYPYNGATTNLESLWMEIPIVTRVGEMFVARNGYTLMTNAGITEGIAWTNEEYIEWAVRLGKDADLRKQISLKLKQSKRNAPLWNSKEFAKQMEYAYKQMWNGYLADEIQNINTNIENKSSMVESEDCNSNAILAAQQGQVELAIQLFKKATSLNPNYVDAHYNFGVFFNQLGDKEQAINWLQKAVSLYPQHSNSLYNLGVILMDLGKVDDAITNFRQVLEISPYDLDTYLALGNAYLEQDNLDKAAKCYRNALRVNPKSASAHCSFAVVMSAQGDYARAISHSQQAIDIDPNLGLAYCNMACALSKFKDRLSESIDYYQKAINIDPCLGEAYWNLTAIFNQPTSPVGRAYPLQKQLADQFVEFCTTEDRVRALSNYITVYNKIGMSHKTNNYLIELENIIYQHSDSFSKVEIQSLYSQFIFTLTSLRDSRELNSRLFKLIGQNFANKVLQQTKTLWLDIKNQPHQDLISKTKKHPRKLRIGFLSSHFKRHPIGWCSLHTVRELSFITPHIYLYSLDFIEFDELTKEFEKCSEQIYFPSKEAGNEGEDSFISSISQTKKTIQQMELNQLDVLIDLDSVTLPSNVQVLYQRPAPICISWLGFDAPYISSDNYWMGDLHTHPVDSEKYYLEKLIRLPNSHMAVSGFEAIPIERDILRQSLGIAPKQIVYLYAAPSRKFNMDSANAHVTILKHVPDSILLQKSGGDLESIQSVYIEACEKQSVDFSRIKFMINTKTEEEHRSIYCIADVFLDAYPYNGGTHNLEALWFELPVVTRVGEQSFARMGYSFLQSVGVSAGIAHSWEEYIEWGIKFGLDHDLLSSVKDQLIQSKRPESLAPLWNPKKLAQDMYKLLENLVLDKSSEMDKLS